MDNGIRIDGQPIDYEIDYEEEEEDEEVVSGIIDGIDLIKDARVEPGKKFHSLASYMREKADWMRKRAEPFDKLAELLEKNEDLVNFIEGYVEGKCSLPK